MNRNELDQNQEFLVLDWIGSQPTDKSFNDITVMFEVFSISGNTSDLAKAVAKFLAKLANDNVLILSGSHYGIRYFKAD